MSIITALTFKTEIKGTVYWSISYFLYFIAIAVSLILKNNTSLAHNIVLVFVEAVSGYFIIIGFIAYYNKINKLVDVVLLIIMLAIAAMYIYALQTKDDTLRIISQSFILVVPISYLIITV
ncbi:MAG: hypothetical protein PQJ46_07680, partial [Spirochaetales bacterium]|nr:hypothetical protein [Spirochaetales bacterium]